MDATKRLYIGDFLAEGSCKKVFNVAASIRSSVDYIDKYKKLRFRLPQHILQNIYVDVPPEIDSKDVVVSRIVFRNYYDYENNINNVNSHLLFAKQGYAPKIYGIVTFIEPKPHNLSGSIVFARIPGYPTPLDQLKKDLKEELFSDNFITMYIFQEKCITDLRTQIDRIYNKIKIINSKRPEIVDKALNEMIDNRVVKYLDDSINMYIDTIGSIELDYKPGNICLQKIDESESESASASTSASTSASAPINYKWTSFDFDVGFTRKINEIPEETKLMFVENAKIYMKVIFFITLSYCFRTRIISDPETTELNEKAINVMAEKIKGIYHIDYDVILKMIKYFVTFNFIKNKSLKIFEGDPIGDYPYMKNTPEYMLRFYAEQYYNQYNDQYGKILVLKTDKIKEAYHNNINPIERDAKIICGILGLDFPGSSVGRAMSTAIPFTSNPYEINPFASGQLPLPASRQLPLPASRQLPLPASRQLPLHSSRQLLPPIKETEIVLSPNPNEIAITPTQNSGLVRQNSYNGQDGGKKRKTTKSNKTKNKKHKRKSRKYTRSRK